MRGALFESFVISEMLKYRFNRSKRSNCYFWRDAQGNKVDCILEYGNNAIPIENQDEKSFIVYGGNENHTRKHAEIIGWDNVDSIMKKCETS